MSGPLTDDQAREAVMNGAKVELVRSPPYLTCMLCGGDGEKPYWLECPGPHDAGWLIANGEKE